MVDRLNKQDLKKELAHFLAKRSNAGWSRPLGAETYEFDIKIRKIDVPDVIRKGAPSDAEVESHISDRIEDTLLAFTESEKRRRPWIKEWAQVACAGQWLLFATDEPLLNEYGEFVVSLREVRNRLDDLNEIAATIREGRAWLLTEFESRHGYPREWVPGRKDWKPKKVTKR